MPKFKAVTLLHTFNFCSMKGKKTGGRQKGTPNKDNPLKAILKEHSINYFTPRPQIDSKGRPKKLSTYDDDGKEISFVILADNNGNPLVMSDFDVDMLQLKGVERVNAELRLLEFHTPKMKAVDVDMNVKEGIITIESRLKQLITEEED